MYAFAILTAGVIVIPATYALFEWIADTTKPQPHAHDKNEAEQRV